MKRLPTSPVRILRFINNRGIRNLTDQNSLINPDPMMYLKALYSNRSQKDYKMVESDTIKILGNKLTKLRKSRFLRSVSLLL